MILMQFCLLLHLLEFLITKIFFKNCYLQQGNKKTRRKGQMDGDNVKTVFPYFTDYLFFFQFLRWNSHSMKLTISDIVNCTSQGHLLRSHCSVTATSTYFQNISITPEENPVPIKQLPFIPPTSPPLPNTNLHSVAMDLPILDASYKWNHIIRDFWVWLLSLSMSSRLVQIVAYISASFLFYG